MTKALRFCEDLLVRAGIIPGSKDYIPFIVLSSFRHGSNLLGTSLKSNNRIVMYSELFVTGRSYWNSGVYAPLRKRHAFSVRDDAPRSFLGTYVYRTYRPVIRAVGFKVMYKQLDCYSNLLTSLIDQRDLRVLHLKRNMLEVLVSSVRAFREGGPVQQVHTRQDDTSFAIEPAEALAYFERLSRWRADYADRFKQHAILEIDYADVVRARERTFDRIQEFLEVPVGTLYSPLVKQRSRPISEVVENFRELEHYFSTTRYAHLFSELTEDT